MDKHEGLKWVFHWGLIPFHFPYHYLFFPPNFAQLTLKRFPFARFPPPPFLCVCYCCLVLVFCLFLF